MDTKSREQRALTKSGGFNWATTFQPWIRQHWLNETRRIGFQLGHDFSAMDTPVSVPDGQGSAPGFNWATTFQPWIQLYAQYLIRKGISFNWATTFQPWIPYRRGVGNEAKTKFQLGHDFSAMDTLCPYPDCGQEIKFQLGHDFSAMDTAAIFRPLLLSEKSRFSHIPSTFMNTFRK